MDTVGLLPDRRDFFIDIIRYYPVFVLVLVQYRQKRESRSKLIDEDWMRYFQDHFD
jgi:hypothetical protein